MIWATSISLVLLGLFDLRIRVSASGPPWPFTNFSCFGWFGVAIGDLDFCSSFISTKQMEARFLLSQLEQVGMMDPQVALILLRLCGGLCKLVHPGPINTTIVHFHQRLSVFLMMTSVGLSVCAWESIPPTLPGNKLSSA